MSEVGESRQEALSRTHRPGAGPVVVARDLVKTYQVGGGLFSKGAALTAVGGASFELEPGQTLAVVGESGSGKSTLARMVTMIEPPDGGDLLIEGRPPSPALRSTVQIVFQDPFGSLNPRHKIGAILEEPLRINRRKMSAAERTEKARDMLARVGLRPEHYDRYPHMFSGGQRQRVAVARALMLDPKVLVLDEPVSALDLSIQSQILNLLSDLQDQLGLAYLLISHDLSVVRHMADAVLVMYLGRPVEIGPAEAVFDNPRHPYTKALMSATPQADPARRQERIRLEGELPSPIRPPSGCPFHPRCWRSQEDCKGVRPKLTEGLHRHACYHPLPDSA